MEQERSKVLNLEKQLAESKIQEAVLEQEHSKVLNLEKQLAERKIQESELEQERSKVLNLEKQLAERKIQEAAIAETVQPVAEAIKPIAETIKPVTETVKPFAENIKPLKESPTPPTPELIAPPVVVVETLAEKVEVAPKQATAKKTKTEKSKEKVAAAIKSPDVIPTVESEAIAINDLNAETPVVELAVESAIAQEPEKKVVTEILSSPVETVNVTETEVATVQSSVTAVSENLEGKNWIILGTLNLINRDRAKELIQASGGHITSSPSGKTDYAIVGKAPGDKLKKAQKLGISQLSESQFLKLFGVEA